ncbi:hypothetical protein E4U21_001888 [Claviceps maximensis]|nr:hypothetical protein E4U21_001888 [Claviceps maximensis]
MSSINSENFLGVALVINRSRDGPAFVFHYPPDVKPVTNQPARLLHSNGAEEDILLERLGQPLNRDPAVWGGSSSSKRHHHHHQHHHYPLHNLYHHRDDRLMAETGSLAVPWERVAGFPTRDLASILTPARSYHKKLFQLSLDPIHCVSYPIHVPENGKWKRSKKASRASRVSKASKASHASKTPRHSEDQLAPHETEPSAPSAANSSTDAAAAAVAKDKDGKKDDADEEKRSSMTMFNLVFILNPKRREGKELVDALYHNVVKKVNKAYKYSQHHCDFVWKESKRILLAKDRAREERKNMAVLWKELIQTFSLAASLHDIYEAISRNKIATLHLDTLSGVLTPSVQIPAPFFVADIPSEHDNSQQGLWLTTSNSFLSNEQMENPDFLHKNFALLLLEDEKKIIAELQADRDLTTVSMMEFARLAKPTMSLYQLCQSNLFTSSQVRKYAQHFIFWRRAIAVPPLHARDVYVVSPNCHLARLPQDAMEWQQAFPLAPPLPNFLSELSYAPRPFKSFCPSKPHRPLYLRMLAWLLRGGWVTQLCTFAYVVVWPEILYEVAYEMEAEELAAAAEEARNKEHDDSQMGLFSSSSSGISPFFARQTFSRQDASMLSSQTTAAARNMSSTTAVPQMTSTPDPTPSSSSKPTQPPPTPSSPQSPSSTATAEPLSPKTLAPPPRPKAQPQPQQPEPSQVPSAAEQAAEQARLERIALKASRDAANKATAHARKTPPLATPHPSLNDSPHLAGLTPHIIMDAKRTTGRESRYLSAIARRFHDDKVRAAWHAMGRYFDGSHALERIALQEDRKRKEVWMLLTCMSEYLLCTRHW